MFFGIIRKLLKWAILILLAGIILVNLFVRFTSSPYIYHSIGNVKEADTALILGAAVYSGGDLSPVFQSRVEKALELYKEGKVKTILVSGDNSTVAHNEVNPVKDYLLKKGVSDKDIFLDHAGFDTYSSMYRARDIFKVKNIIVVTQAFHLPRAVFIARNLGIDAYGYSAPDGSEKLKNYIRESLATEKAVLNLIFKREPKFLGDVIPIENVL